MGKKLLENGEELNDGIVTLFNDISALKRAIEKLNEENNDLRTRMFEMSRKLSLLYEKLEDLHWLIAERSNVIKTYAKVVSRIEGRLGK